MQGSHTTPGEGALLALDLGSTWLKASAFAPDGVLLAGRRAPVPVRVTPTGAREQDPRDWWHAAAGLVRRLLDDGIAAGDVLGISLTGRGASPVFLDADGEPVAPVWMDARSATEERRARERAAALGLFTGSYAVRMAGRLAWLRERDSSAFRRLRVVMHAKDCLLFRLTGEVVTDPASGPDADDWPLELYDEVGVAGVRLPSVRPGWAIAGRLTEAASQALGLPAGLPVAVGAHDGVAANIGAGAAQPGEAALTLGTHAVIRGVVAEVAPGARRFYGLLPGRVCVGGNALYGGRSVDWFVDATGGDGGDRDGLLTSLDAAAAVVPAGSNGALFLPFLGGSVSPHVRPLARGGFAGLSVDMGRPALYRAVLEGVAYALRGIRDELAGWGVRPRELRLSGGGARSATWRAILADVLETPIVPTPDFAEGRGAAACLAVALGCHADVDAAVAAMVRPGPAVEPDRERAARYAEGYPRFQRVADALYEAEKPA